MKDSIIRSDKEFKKFLREIKVERIKKGIDKEPLSDRRLTLAITRIPGIRDVLGKASITKEEKKKIEKEMLK